MLSKQAGNSLVILLIIAGLITGGVLLERSLEKSSQITSQSSDQIQQLTEKPTVALSIDQSIRLNKLKKGDIFTVSVSAKSREAVNIISTKIKYPKDIVKVASVEAIEKDNPVSLWVTKSDIPEESLVQLVGGIPTPGFSSDTLVAFAKVTFQLLTPGRDFSIVPEGAELYSNQTNQPLSEVAVIGIHSQPGAEASTSPSASPSPEASKKPGGRPKGGSLSLSPSVIQSSSSCTFDVSVDYDAEESDFVGIDALLTVDPRVLTPVKIVTSENKPDALHGPQLSFSNDTVTIAYVAPKTRQYQKKGSLGKITFKVTDQKAEGMTAIKVKNSRKPGDLTDSNILASITEDILTTSKDTFVFLKPGSCSGQTGSYEILPTR